jgi:hypothetical protein
MYGASMVVGHRKARGMGVSIRSGDNTGFPGLLSALAVVAGPGGLLVLNLSGR